MILAALSPIACLSLAAFPQTQDPLGRAERGAAARHGRALFVVRDEDPSTLPGFGYSVGGGKDVDADGVSDWIVGGPYEGSSGVAKVYSGATGALLVPALEHETAEMMGFSVALIGDLSGDGRSEILVGDPMLGGVGPGGTGQVFVFDGEDGSLRMQLYGSEASDEFGWAVCGLGDVDGDTLPDFAVGALEEHGTANGAGYVRVFSGASGGVIRTHTTGGVHRRYGHSLASVGDVNADGVPDLLIGASRVGSGQVQLRSGANGALLWQASGLDYGVSVALAGDVNADGAVDVAVGAPGQLLVRVLRASDGAFVADFPGPPSAFYFGGAVAGLGDVDGDGHADLAIGDKWASPIQAFTGATWIRSGADGSVLALFRGHHGGDDVGFALATIGDLDGDGASDFVTGADGFAVVYPGGR